MRLDPPLRFAAASAMTDRALPDEPQSRHARGTVLADQRADPGHHRRPQSTLRRRSRQRPATTLNSSLQERPASHPYNALDVDAMHDFNVTLDDGTLLRVECKNASPKTSADGKFKVEVQARLQGRPASGSTP